MLSPTATRRRRVAAALLLSLASAKPGFADRFPATATLERELRAFVELHRGAPGVVLGVIDDGGRRVLAVGESGRPDRPRLDGATRFEIGSISKTFTGLLLAEMIRSGEVTAEQRVATLFPSSITLANGVQDASLEQLATHTSGLPRIAVDLPSLARTLSLDPYRGTTAEDVFRSVSRVPSVSPRPGDSVAYSNLGYALLGRLLERRAGRPYEELLRERVLVPLGLQSIATAHEESAPIELAVGHGPGGRPTPYWHVDGYAPAGCLIASADQLLDYVAIQLAPASHPGLAEAQRLRVSFPDHKGVGLGWMHAEIGGHRTIWHNGATGGFRSFVGFLPDEGRGFVVLANGQGDLDALARRLLDPAEPPLPGRDANVWTAIAITLALLAWGPLALADTLRRARSVQRPAANEEAAKPPPGIGRLDVARSPLSPAIALVLAERLGAWPELPFAAWWLALAASVVVFAALARRARDLPWWRGGAKRALGLASMTALEVVVLAFLFS